jgi:hypothetical protein
MQRLPKYQDYAGITYEDYRVGSERLNNIRSYVSKHIEARNRLAAIDHVEYVGYDTFHVEVPRSLLRLKRRILLSRPILPDT